MKKLILLLLIFSSAMFAGCMNDTANNPPQIAPMELSAAQREIVDMLSHPGHEVLLFDYTGGPFAEIEVWVEVYHYGEFIGHSSGIGTSSNPPMGAGSIAITISQPNRNEFQWSISIGSSTGRSSSTGAPWAMQGEYFSRSFGPIIEPVEIADGQEIILYLSKFTTGSSLSTMSDLQHYLQYPEELAGFTYVHLIKARFTERR